MATADEEEKKVADGHPGTQEEPVFAASDLFTTSPPPGPDGASASPPPQLATAVTGLLMYLVRGLFYIMLQIAFGKLFVLIFSDQGSRMISLENNQVRV